MKRFHVHLSVPDLPASVRFYTALFGTGPTVEKPDYAKWMIDDPRVNFAISASPSHAGLHHLGLQVDTAAELAQVRAAYGAADPASLVDEAQAQCCYALSDKHWVNDPQGIAWEGFRTLGALAERDGPATDACCVGTPAPAGGEAREACCATASVGHGSAPPSRACGG